MNCWIEENEIMHEDESYVLDVSSPGIDRDLTLLKDFSRIKGRKVELWTSEKVNGKEIVLKA